MYGECWQDNGEIFIDPRQTSKDLLDTLIHEMLHCFFIDLSEKSVKRISKYMNEVIWNKGYRRVHK